jgi:hypothetical protein
MTIATRLEHDHPSASVYVFPDTLAMQGPAKHERTQSFVSLERRGIIRRMRVSSVQRSRPGSQEARGYCRKGVYVGPVPCALATSWLDLTGSPCIIFGTVHMHMISVIDPHRSLRGTVYLIPSAGSRLSLWAGGDQEAVRREEEDSRGASRREFRVILPI